MITEAFLIKFLTALCMQLAENDPFPVRSVYAAISWQDATLPRMIAVFGRLPSAAIGDERHESSVTEIQHETGLVPEVVAKAHLLNSSRFPTYASLNKPIMKSSPKGGLIYSTDGGRMCPECRQPLAACVCKTAAKTLPAGDGVVRVSRETKGRGGKSVTLVKGLALDPLALALLGKQLRTACGSGGTVKDGVIEVQGDHCERVIEALKKAGHNAKKAGG
jgi:translation initiation factor 1